MNPPVMDPRSRQALMAEVAAHARQYTPEWRYEGAEDDPGAAIAQLFGEMFYQTVDRFNSVPERLFTEFLELAGVQMPDPMPAEGLLRFTPHDTVEEPVPVPRHTQVFTPDENGENIVYETVRPIQATAAKLTHIYYVDAREEVIQALNLTRPQLFFAPNGGENLQRHRFSVSQDEVLTLDGRCTVEVEIRAENRFAGAETARLLASEGAVWSYRSGGGEVPFDTVAVEGDRILLTKEKPEPLEPEADGHRYVTCSGRFPGGAIRVDGVGLSSRPEGLREAERLAWGDDPITLPDGGYCFGRRPSPYALFYLRSDQVFSKRGATAVVRLDITPVVTAPKDNGPQYTFNQRIIDKKDAVTVTPDDVYVDEVVWEYYNGRGWTNLPVSGDRNPFSCQREGTLETVFRVPEDLREAEVNAEVGLYIRARVAHVENEFSTLPRWIVPYVKGAVCGWQYAAPLPAERYRAENNGSRRELTGAEGMAHLRFPAIVSMAQEPRAMYLCFDRSPHAMPLSLLFEAAGQGTLDDKIAFEAWTGNRFEPVRWVDLTRNLLHTGLVLLYLPRPLPEAEFFGQKGCWLRMVRSAYLESGVYPRIAGVQLNAVDAVQCRDAEEQWFDVGVYEANKQIWLLEKPVQNCQVWVDEIGGLVVADAEALEEAMPGRVRLEREDSVLTHCWVRWERLDHLALADGETRGYQLEPYEGVLTFGDGVHGRVPPAGERSLRVRYASGGGSRGNLPAGKLTEPVGALPRISSLVNLTAMSGGTDRFPMEQLEALGNKRLRHRGRALGVSDYEEMVAEAFPQARHVKCFSGLDGDSRPAAGHVTVVVEGCAPEERRATADLCDKIYDYLEQRCSCTLTAAGLLHVIPSTVVTVNTEAVVEMEDLGEAAATQQAILRRLTELIRQQWRQRDIGDQVRISQLRQTIQDTPNVRRVQKLLVEGVYEWKGIRRSIPLEGDGTIPYATVRSGTHTIQIT